MRIAVIGSGISGLGAAYALRQKHSVEVFEQDTRAGGHTNTISVETGAGTLPLDTGFIVHSRPNYPNLVRLFDELGVRTQPSEMSFAVSCRGCGLEYSGRRPFAQARNAIRPSHYRLLWDIGRFMRTAEAALQSGRLEGLTLDEYVRTDRFSPDFRNHFLVPLTAALWSTSPQQSADFPIDHAVRFFAHHSMLGFRRSTWRTVTRGARTYVDAIVERLGDHVHLGRGVRRVVRTPHGAELTAHDGERQEFDAVVLATHADTSLALLADPSDEETRLLGAFPYTRNAAVLHTDASLLPRKRAARASWNYQLADCDSRSKEPTMTYYVNRLQGLSEAEHYCVTLNQATDIAESTVLERIEYEHPLFSAEGVRAQSQLGAIQGSRRTYFCGAWQGFGFHEDGLTSGLRVAEALGAAW
jgi:predicted NAD/FAD-binding protein